MARSRVLVVAALLMLAPALHAHIHLDTPVGGEVLVAGETFTISWRILVVHDLENWDLWYSETGSGGPWIPVVTDLAAGDPTFDSVHTYEWLVPDGLTTSGHVRILMDNVGEEEDIYAISPESFFIVDEIDAPTFRRGDCNGNGALEIADAIGALSYLFGDGDDPPCLAACDAGDDGEVDVADPVLLLSYLFVAGAPPAVPTVTCGWDPTPAVTAPCDTATGSCPGP